MIYYTPKRAIVKIVGRFFAMRQIGFSRKIIRPDAGASEREIFILFHFFDFEHLLLRKTHKTITPPTIKMGMLQHNICLPTAKPPLRLFSTCAANSSWAASTVSACSKRSISESAGY